MQQEKEEMPLHWIDCIDSGGNHQECLQKAVMENPNRLENCNNGVDDDRDGQTDEADCIFRDRENCNNGVDDDLDGKVDLEDPDCGIIAN